MNAQSLAIEFRICIAFGKKNNKISYLSFQKDTELYSSLYTEYPFTNCICLHNSFYTKYK